MRHAEECAGPPPPLLLTGIAQFNQGEYFHCHETLEELWKAERGSIRELYRGILQVAVGCYHLQRSNAYGARFSFEQGILRLRAFAPTCLGVAVSELIAAAESLSNSVTPPGSGTHLDREQAPVIRIADDASRGSS